MGIRASRFSRSPSNVAFRCEGNGEAFKGEEVATPDLFLLSSFPRIQENPSSGDSHRQFSFLFFSWNSVCKKKRNIEKRGHRPREILSTLFLSQRRSSSA